QRTSTKLSSPPFQGAGAPMHRYGTPPTEGISGLSNLQSLRRQASRQVDVPATRTSITEGAIRCPAHFLSAISLAGQPQIQRALRHGTGWWSVGLLRVPTSIIHRRPAG